MNFKHLALASLGAAVLAVPGVASAHTAVPHLGYPTLASFYQGTGNRNVMYFENRIAAGSGWFEGGYNARDFQVAINGIMNNASFGADVRPEVNFKRYWYLYQEGMSPYYNNTQGDLVLTNGAQGTGAWCGGQTALACHYPVTVQGGAHMVGGLIVLNDSYVLSPAFKKRITRHEVGHDGGLGHTSGIVGAMDITAPCHVSPDPTDAGCYWFNNTHATDSDKIELWNVYTHQYNFQGWNPQAAPVPEASTLEGIERPGKFKPFTIQTKLTKKQRSDTVALIKRHAPAFYAKLRTGTIAIGDPHGVAPIKAR
jgi:hypothetical protein